LRISKALKLIVLILFFTSVFSLFSVRISDPDFWWHLKTGEYIYHTGSLPGTDPFSYTSLTKVPFSQESKRSKFILTQYWLAQLILYGIYHYFNLQGIVYLRASIFTLLIFLIYKEVRKEGLGPYLSILLLIPAILILNFGFKGERPQLFSFLLAFLLVYLLEEFRRISLTSDYQRSQKPPITATIGYLIPIPLIMLFWANLHGGFILGTVIILGYLFCEVIKYITKRLGQPLPFTSLKYLIITSILSIFLSFINPNGYNFISVLLEPEISFTQTRIIEWMSPFVLWSSHLYRPVLIICWILLFIILSLFFANIRKLDLTDLVIITGLTAMIFYAARFIPFFTPVAIIMIARYGARTSKKLPQIEKFKVIGWKSEMVFSVLLFATFIFILIKVPFLKNLMSSKPLERSHIVAVNDYPEGAVRFLRENKIPGNMFNPYVWGGYLIWALYPDYKVFVDGRVLTKEVFFREVRIMGAYSRDFEGVPEWKALLNDYRVNFILTFSVDRYSGRLIPLIPAILNDPEWKLIYMDNISLIFLKNTLENREIIDRFEMPKEWLWNEVITETIIKSKGLMRKNINFYVTMGDAYFAKKSYAEARALYMMVIEKNPENNIIRGKLDFLNAHGY
jgi:hypothetical protein